MATAQRINRRLAAVLCSLLLFGAGTHILSGYFDAPKGGSIDYVGGVVLFSETPDDLAAWYSNRFGIELPVQHEGGHFGKIQTSDGPVHIGISGFMPGMPVTRGGNISITFHVTDFDARMKMLKKNGLEPLTTFENEDGKFAYFADPDGNSVGIWGK